MIPGGARMPKDWRTQDRHSKQGQRGRRFAEGVARCLGGTARTCQLLLLPKWSENQASNDHQVFKAGASLCLLPSRKLTWNLGIDRWKNCSLYNQLVLGGSMLICRGSTFFLCIYVIWFDMLHMFFELGKTIRKAFILSLFDFNWQGVPCVNMCCWPSPQYPHQSDPLLCKVPSSSSVFASARASASSSSSKISKAQVKSGREPRVPPYFMDDKGYVYVQEHVDDKSICVGVFTSTSNTWFSSFRHMVLNS